MHFESDRGFDKQFALLGLARDGRVEGFRAALPQYVDHLPQCDIAQLYGGGLVFNRGDIEMKLLAKGLDERARCARTRGGWVDHSVGILIGFDYCDPAIEVRPGGENRIAVLEGGLGCNVVEQVALLGA